MYVSSARWEGEGCKGNGTNVTRAYLFTYFFAPITRDAFCEITE